MRPPVATALLVALVACAAASANVMRLDEFERPQRQPDSVQFLVDEPDRPYVAIALVEVTDKGAGLSLETLRRKLADEAARLGGDAVVLSRRTTPGGAVLIPIGRQVWALNVQEQELIGKVIVWTR